MAGGIKAIVVGPAMGHDDDEEEMGKDDEASDYRQDLRPAAESLVKALGLKSEDVDLDGVCDALADAHAICAGYVEGGESKGEDEGEKSKEY